MDETILGCKNNKIVCETGKNQVFDALLKVNT